MKNFKEHAIFRYLSRKLGEHIINDKTFQTWKKMHGNKEIYDSALKELSKIEAQCDFRVTAKVGHDQKRSEYAINTKEMAVFVIDRNDVITYYKLEYCSDISNASNLTIFKTLQKEYNSIDKKLNSFEERNSKKIEKSNGRIELYNSEILVLEEKIKQLKLRKEIEKDTINSINQDKEVLTKNQNTVLLKMVKPIVTL